jgi:hypothetical protein
LLSENNFQGQIQLSGGAVDFLKIVAELVSDFKELLNTNQHYRYQVPVSKLYSTKHHLSPETIPLIYAIERKRKYGVHRL